MRVWVLLVLAMVCLAVEARSPEPECTGVLGQDRWKEECNWCNCRSGVPTCSRKFCPPGYSPQPPECEGNPTWKNGCNKCSCNNGTAVCTDELCIPATPQRAPQCQGDSLADRWKQDCNWCSCNNGVGRCTRRLCRPGEEEEGPECEGNPSWKKDCNSCYCRNGRAVCTSKFCGPITPPQVPQREPECQGDPETDRWREGRCTWCTCRNGLGTCTRTFCRQADPDNEGPECEGNPSWKKDCNSCYCHNGRAVCTSKFCGGPLGPPAVSEVQVQVVKIVVPCVEGSQWRQACNWCTCEDGVSNCTESSCPDWNEHEAQEEGTVECYGNSRWKKDCNWCQCSNGRGVCTTRACIPPERDPFHNLPEGSVCVPGSRWKEECNWCSCGSTGIAGCTQKACPGYSPAPGEKTCEEDSVWKSDECNICRCIRGVSACTKRLCRPPTPPPTPEEPQCQGDSPADRWKQDCNWCSCNNGVGRCTRRLCRPGEEEEGPECEGNPSWKKDCNSCSCHNGRAVCTTKFCGPVHTPETPVAVQTVKIGDGGPTCEDGSRWREACNWCSCSEGKALCEKNACPDVAPGDPTSDEPECEGDARWKRDCNSCSCRNGIGLCTKMACIVHTNKLCIEGASWREDCNLCRCSNGQTLCTKKLCMVPQGRQLQESQCEQGEAGGSCSSRTLPALCYLPPTSNLQEAAACIGFFRRWTYNSDAGRCLQTIYGGCRGSDNLFGTLEECEEACPSNPVPQQTQQTRTYGRQLSPVTGQGRCSLPHESGPCFGSLHRYHYDATSDSCKEFLYGGCQGNANNFETIEECLTACKQTEDSSRAARCDRSSCPWHQWGHYLAKECLPQYLGDACCPTSFQCPSASEITPDPSKCYYKGKPYNIGDTVPVDDPCSASCYCASGFNGPAEVRCADIECPDLFRPPTPGCRPLYRVGDCCAYDHDCVDPNLPPVLESRAATCTWENKTYQEGDKMFFDSHPCQQCICGPGFTGPTGPGCFKIGCGLEFRYSSRYSAGCTPIFFEGGCCPISWLCPGDQMIKPPTSQEQETPVGDAAVCRLGERSIAVGMILGLTDCKIKCQCVTPPELTCNQYRSCEVAQEASDAKVCPLLACASGCHPTVSAPGECPTCSCSSSTFTCPALTCPSTCHPILDLQTGCSSCKCPCTSQAPCPADCPTHTVVDETTGCQRCECVADHSRGRSFDLHAVNFRCAFPPGSAPCPLDCAVIRTEDENGCEVCKCDPNNPGNPFIPPIPPVHHVCVTDHRGRAPCPLDCAVIITEDENGCEVCKCDPNNPGNPFIPPPPVHHVCVTDHQGRAPCPMDCAVIRTKDENGCEVCKCDPNNPGNPFIPPPPVHHVCVTDHQGRAPCPMDCAVIRMRDENGCEVCKCDPNNPGNPFGPYRPINFKG